MSATALKPATLLVVLAGLGASTGAHAQEAGIDAISAGVESAAPNRVTLIVSVTDGNGKPVDAFVRAFDHIGPPPPLPIGSSRGGFDVYAWLCETFTPTQGACGWVRFKVDGAVKVLKGADQGQPVLPSSIYRFDVVPDPGSTIGTDALGKPDRHVSFLVRARVTRAVPGPGHKFDVLSQREAVTVWSTPAKRP